MTEMTVFSPNFPTENFYRNKKYIKEKKERKVCHTVIGKLKINCIFVYVS